STPTAAAPAAPTRAPATAAKPATDTAAPARSTPVPPVRDDRTREERRVDALLDADLHDERSHFQRSRDEAADEKRAREAFAAKRVAADGADLVKTLRDDLAGAAREGGAQ
ncbi:MAG: hypothetical protein HOW73_32980, partial [Polyangiaceae bacterium]|nr:hypothetical protein [Polyangiaceae bacterium]